MKAAVVFYTGQPLDEEDVVKIGRMIDGCVAINTISEEDFNKLLVQHDIPVVHETLAADKAAQFFKNFVGSTDVSKYMLHAMQALNNPDEHAATMHAIHVLIDLNNKMSAKVQKETRITDSVRNMLYTLYSYRNGKN